MSKLTDEEFDDLLKLVTYKTGCQLKRYRHKTFYPTLITIFEDSVSQHVLIIRFRSFKVDVNKTLYGLGKRIHRCCDRVLACYFLSEATCWDQEEPDKKRPVIGIYGMSKDRRANLGILEVRRERQRICPGRIVTIGCAETTSENVLCSFFAGYEQEAAYALN